MSAFHRILFSFTFLTCVFLVPRGHPTSAQMIVNQEIDAKYNRKAEIAFSNGLQAYNRKEYVAALKELSVAIEAKPDMTMAYYYSGLAWQKNGAPLEAVQNFGRAIKLNPFLPNVMMKRAESYKSLGELRAAVNDLSFIIDRGSRNRQAIYERGLLYEELGEEDLALKDYEWVGAHYPAALIYLGRAGYQSALDHFDAIIGMGKNDTTGFKRPKDDEIHYNRGLALYHLGREHQAEEAISLSLRMNPYRANAFYIRGVIYYNRRWWNDAKADFDTALKLNPDLFEAQKYLTHTRKKLRKIQ